MDATNKITIDVSDPLNTPVIKAVQEDIRSRYVEITLVSNGQALTIPNDAHGIIGIKRPNGTYVLYDQTEDETDAVTFDGNVATAYLSQEALALAGELYTSVSVYTSNQRLTAFHFIVSVDATAVPSDAVVKSDYFNILEGVLEDTIAAAERAEDAAASVADVVSYGVAQTLTDTEKETARSNIGAAAVGAAPAAHHATHEAGGSDPISFPTASTSGAGIVQLYDGADSTSTTMAATAAALKALHDNPLSVSVISSEETGGVTMTKNTWTKLASVALTAGVWLISGYASMTGASSASTKRLICISETSGADSPVSSDAELVGLSAGDGAWRETLTIFANLSAATTYYLNARQESSGNLTTMVYGIRAMKLS